MMEFELGCEISKLLIGDINNIGKNQIICCTAKGEVYGYIYVTEDRSIKDYAAIKESKIDKDDIIKYEKMMDDRKVNSIPYNCYRCF